MFLKFEYNLDKDIYNYFAINGAKHKGGSSRALEYYFKKFPELSEENLKKFIAGYISYNNVDINKRLEEIKSEWSAIEGCFIDRMNSFFKINFPLEKFISYLTTADRCTLGKDYFFVAIFSKNTNRIIMHELLHFYTYIDFEKEFSKLNNKQIYDVKESITELLNIEFLDLIKTKEDGYLQHKELREKFKEFWTEDKNIKRAVNQLIELVK